MQNLGKRLRRPLRLPRIELFLPQLPLAESLGVRVQAQQDLSIPQRVLLLHARTLRPRASLGRTHHGLHFRGVDETADVRIGDDVRGEEEVLLERGRGAGGAVDVVERGEGGGGPDDEAAEVAPRRELEEVEREHGRGLDAGDVAEGAHELLAVGVGVVDDQWAAALHVAATAEFALAGAELAGFGHFADVWAGTDGFEETEGGGGFADGGALEGFGGDDKGDFWDGRDAVATGLEQSGDGRGGQGRGGRETSRSLSGWVNR